MAARGGFSKADLVVMLALAGILVALLVPNVLALRMQAVRAEVPAVVDSIRSAEVAYGATQGAFLDAERHPRASPDEQAVDWPRTNEAFEVLGFTPAGSVRGVYQVTEASTSDFRVSGMIDADGDGRSATYTATRRDGAALRPGDERRY